VHDAAVIAVPDERWGERPLAVVVLLDGIAPDPQALIGHLRLRHPGWWVPERFEFVDMIPRTAAGKTRKVDLRAQYVESALG
jgi:fatty-acyl-CoA synthase